MIEVIVHLFGKPAWEMKIEGQEKIFPSMLREKGVELKERLERAATILETLTKNGWSVYGTLYDLNFSKDVDTEEEAKEELKKLGIDPDEVSIIELEEEE